MVSKCCWPAGNTSCLRERHRLRESVSTVGSHHSMGPHPKASFVMYINRWAKTSGGEGFTSIWKHTYTHEQLNIHKHMHQSFSSLASSACFTVCHHVQREREACHRLTVNQKGRQPKTGVVSWSKRYHAHSFNQSTHSKASRRTGSHNGWKMANSNIK